MTETLHQLAARRGVAWPLRTERLVIAPLGEADVDELWDYWKLPETSRWTTALAESPQDLAERWLPRQSQMVVRLHDGTTVGDLMLRIEDPWAQREVAEEVRGLHGELGWTLDPRHQGRGYATEMVRALMDLAFGALGLRRLEATCFAANEPSWHLMERLGMRRETHAVRDAFHRDHGWMDTLVYALLAEERQG